MAASVKSSRLSTAPMFRSSSWKVLNEADCHRFGMASDLPPDIVLVRSMSAANLLGLFVRRHIPAVDELHSFLFGLYCSVPPTILSHTCRRPPRVYHTSDRRSTCCLVWDASEVPSRAEPSGSVVEPLGPGDFSTGSGVTCWA